MPDRKSKVHARQTGSPKSRDLYRLLFESANDAILLIEQGRVVDCNASTLALFGCAKEEVFHQTLLKFSPPTQPDGQESEQVLQEKMEAALTGQPQQFEWLYQRPDTETFYAEVALNRVEFDGNPFIQVLVHNITGYKQTEEAFKNSERRLGDIINFLPDPTFAIDTAGKLIAWNQAMEDLTGIKAEHILGKGDYEYALPFCGSKRPILIDEVLQQAEAVAQDRPDSGLPAIFTDPDRKVRIALVRGLSEGSFMERYLAGATAMANELGLELTETSARGDQVKMVSLVEEAIRQRVDAIVINHGQTDLLQPAIKTALEAGIKVVAFDVVVDDPTVPEIEQDDMLIGFMLSKKLAADAGGQANVTYINAEGFAPLVKRDRAWQDFKWRYNGLNEVSRMGAVTDNTAADAQTSLAALLNEHPTPNAVLAMWDEFAKGAVRAVTQTGLADQVKVYSVDITSEDIKMMTEPGSPWTATVATDSYSIGRLAVRAAVALVAGEQLDKYLLVEPVLITQDFLVRHKINNMNELVEAMPALGESQLAWFDWMGPLMARGGHQVASLVERDEDSLVTELFTPFVRKAGGVFLLAKARPLYDVRGKVVGAIESVRDVTQRKRLEQQFRESLERRIQQSETSTEVAQEIALAPNLADLFHRVVTLVQERLGYDRVGVYTLEEDHLMMQEVAGKVGGKLKEAGHKIAVGSKKSLVARVAREGEPALASTTPSEPDGTPHPSPLQTRSELAVPIKWRERVLGVLHIQSDRVDPLSEEDQLLLMGLCGQIAVAINSRRAEIKRKQAEEALARRATELQTVAQVSIAASTILDTQSLLEKVVDLIKSHFELYHAHLYLLNEAGNILQLAAGAGEVGALMVAQGWNIPLARQQSLVAQAARSRQGVVANDVQATPEFMPNPFLPETRSELAVPLIVGERLLGVLDVQSDQANHFSEDDIHIQATLAAQVAIALTNARLFEEMTRSKKEVENAKEKAEQAREAAEAAKNEAERAREAVEAEKEKAETANQTLAAQMWQTAGQAQLNERMRGEQDVPTLAGNVIQQLCKYLNAQVGALYVLEEQILRLAGSFAYNLSRPQAQQFRLGEGLAGQAALQQQPLLIADIPDDHLNLSTSLGELRPRHILAAPFAYNGHVAGVVELGTLTTFSPSQAEFLHLALESIAIAFTTAQARRRVNELLEETQQQAEELQVQEEELRAANEELETQTENLRASEAKLRSNQAQLEQVNAELEEKAGALEKNTAVLREQQSELDRQNRELKTAQQELEQKAAELALASKYKSEFLANMSHELRTPLNSLLILAGMLAKNEEGNLTPEQIDSAQIIHSGGVDLLNLINEILDLSKVEAGKIDFYFVSMPLERLLTMIRTQFSRVAESKGLAFEISVAEDVPDVIETDQQRVGQIIKNLLSNAFKFTHQGSVRLDIYRPQPGVDLRKSGLNPAEAIAFRVTDTGIGMTQEQQKLVFEAFQQADGSTSRQYGGTGLGLTISRELVTRLGGQIELESEKDKGSIFTFYLPIQGGGESAKRRGETEDEARKRRGEEARRRGDEEERRRGDADASSRHLSSPPASSPPVSSPPLLTLPDDRDKLQPGDRVLLIIEDDPKFAEVVYNYGHKKRFKCLLAGDGETGLQLAHTYPADAIILDLNLPDRSGWEILDTLKDNPATRHIPVHIISAIDEDFDAYKRGAMGFLTKPVDQAHLEDSFQKIESFMARKIKNLLLVEDDASLRKSVHKLLEGNDVVITEADLGRTALEQLASQHFDCMILDLSLPDMSGFELLNRLHADESLAKCPVIVYTGKALTEEENRELLKYADSVIVKGVKSPERLLDETALFLHRVIANLPEEKQQAIKRLHDSEAVFTDRRILIVDDDARNAFALSKLLAGKGLKVSIVSNGQKALEVLDEASIDLVLMDIMMPGMDGYETTRRIRAQQKLRRLPVLALTAKAMKGDREKCLEAGANDYLSKPIDPDRLFSMLRVWLSRDL